MKTFIRFIRSVSWRAPRKGSGSRSTEPSAPGPADAPCAGPLDQPRGDASAPKGMIGRARSWPRRVAVCSRYPLDSQADSQQECFSVIAVSVVDVEVSQVAGESSHRTAWTTIHRIRNQQVAGSAWGGLSSSNISRYLRSSRLARPVEKPDSLSGWRQSSSGNRRGSDDDEEPKW